MKSRIIYVMLIASLANLIIIAEENKTQEISQISELNVLNVLQVAWNHDLSMFAVLTGFEIQVWDTDDWGLLYTIPEAYSYKIAWHPNKNLIAGLNCCEGEKLSIWNGETGKLEFEFVKQMPTNTPIVNIRRAMSWSPDGSQIATDSWLDTITLWDIDSKTYHSLVPIIEPDWHDVVNLAWSPDADYLLSTGIDGYDSSSIRVWDTKTGEQIFITPGYKYASWHPDGTLFANAGTGNLINIWDLETNQLVNSFEGHTHTITSMDWNTNGVHIASADANGELIIWDYIDGERLEFDACDKSPVRQATWRPDGHQLAIITLESITIFDW